MIVDKTAKLNLAARRIVFGKYLNCGQTCVAPDYVYCDESIREELVKTCDNQPFIAKAPMVLIFCADQKRWFDLFRRYQDDVRLPDAGDLFLAQQDALIAAQNAVVAASSLGIGSCYIGDILENYEIHRELLHLPAYVVPACMVVFGYPTVQQQEARKVPRFQVDEIVHENGYDAEKTADMPAMLRRRQQLTEETLPGWVQRFCRRKWNSDFSREMSRSSREILRNYCK